MARIPNEAATPEMLPTVEIWIVAAAILGMVVTGFLLGKAAEWWRECQDRPV